MNEGLFWETIESAWSAVGGKAADRARIASGSLSDGAAKKLQADLDRVVPVLQRRLEVLAAPELLEFDRILERKLYEIDRAEVQEYTDGSDDGFLYARGFIVAIGKAYYDAVNSDPSRAMMDLECEQICYLPWHIYDERYGAAPHADISRETGSNAEGWRES